MKKFRYLTYALGILVSAAILQFVPSTGMADGMKYGEAVMMAKITPDTVVDNHEPAILDKDNPQVKAVAAIQGRHHKELMGIPEVVGTAVGQSDTGEISVLVLTKKKTPAGILPESLEGVPAIEKVTGDITAMPSKKNGRLSPTSVWPRPVPTGVSTGNAGECSAGTISARVVSGSTYYALSNNHVYSLEGKAQIGSEVLQPGRYDTNCVYSYSNVIGNLAAAIPIIFSGGTNTVDAAIATTTTTFLGNATPADGYGRPNSTTLAASLNMGVQKYGRTTKLTKGTITGINATVTVNYGASGTATFVNQIIVSSNKPFIKAGDSGSLLVTNDTACNPVGLLFAGNSSGSFSIANPIDLVLTRLESLTGSVVTIDGK